MTDGLMELPWNIRAIAFVLSRVKNAFTGTLISSIIAYEDGIMTLATCTFNPPSIL